MAPGAARWAVSFVLVIGPYLLLGRGLVESRKMEKRTYSYAE
jgi:hypothetical protein